MSPSAPTEAIIKASSVSPSSVTIEIVGLSSSVSGVIVKISPASASVSVIREVSSSSAPGWLTLLTVPLILLRGRGRRRRAQVKLVY